MERLIQRVKIIAQQYFTTIQISIFGRFRCLFTKCKRKKLDKLSKEDNVCHE